jgi:hypothetical protein
MRSMAYTSEQLTQVEAALASGTLRVEINGRVVQYQSPEMLMRLRDQMRAELGESVPSAARGRAWNPITGRGL